MGERRGSQIQPLDEVELLREFSKGIQQESVRYYSRNGTAFAHMGLRERQDALRGIVVEALSMCVEGDQSRVGYHPQGIVGQIREGLDIRNERLRELSRVVMRDLKGARGTTDLLGVDKSLTYGAMNEWNRRFIHTISKMKNTNELYSQVRRREGAMRLIAYTYTSANIEALVGTEDENSRRRAESILEAISNNRFEQAVLVRGLMLSAIGFQMGVEVNPLFADYRSLERMSEFALLNSKDGQMDEHVRSGVKTIMSAMEDADIVGIAEMIRGQEAGKEGIVIRDMEEVDLEEMWSAVAEYLEIAGKYVSVRLVNWAGSTVRNNDGIWADRYWEQFFDIFEGFPISRMSTFTPDVDFIMSPSEVRRAEEQNIPHLWENGLVQEGVVIPDYPELVSTLRMMEQVGYGPGNSHFERVRGGVELWRKLHKIRRDNSEARMAQYEGYIENARAAIGDAVLELPLDASTTMERAKLHKVYADETAQRYALLRLEKLLTWNEYLIGRREDGEYPTVDGLLSSFLGIMEYERSKVDELYDSVAMMKDIDGETLVGLILPYDDEVIHTDSYTDAQEYKNWLNEMEDLTLPRFEGGDDSWAKTIIEKNGGSLEEISARAKAMEEDIISGGARKTRGLVSYQEHLSIVGNSKLVGEEVWYKSLEYIFRLEISARSVNTDRMISAYLEIAETRLSLDLLQEIVMLPGFRDHERFPELTDQLAKSMGVESWNEMYLGVMYPEVRSYLIGSGRLALYRPDAEELLELYPRISSSLALMKRRLGGIRNDRGWMAELYRNVMEWPSMQNNTRGRRFFDILMKSVNRDRNPFMPWAFAKDGLSAREFTEAVRRRLDVFDAYQAIDDARRYYAEKKELVDHMRQQIELLDLTQRMQQYQRYVEEMKRVRKGAEQAIYGEMDKLGLAVRA